MKLFDKKSLILLISVVSINLLCIISVSYAYFTANIIGNDKAEEMTVTAGTMKITYTDSNIVTLNNAIPGDTLTKQFKVENTGNLDTKYNIKIKVDANDFKDKKDLVYTLTKNGVVEPEKVLPYEDGYIVIENEIKEKGIDNYTLTLNFKKDESNQNDNANKKVKFKIEVDSETDVRLYEYEEPLNNNFYNTMITSEDTLYDDYGNLRYVGYNKPTEETCEKWRIIGLFKDIQKPGGTSEDLVKIIRADSIGNIAWDSNNSNNWETSSLNTLLNNDYINDNEGRFASVSSIKAINKITLEMIENVKWNLGGSPDYRLTTKQFYEYERGNIVPNGAQSILDGYIGLMYPSDYGYATSGLLNSEQTNREECLNQILYNWRNEEYKTNCAQNSWLLDSTRIHWTLMPISSTASGAYDLNKAGFIGTSATNNGSSSIRPTLYLKSNIKVLSGNGSTEPYVLAQE